MIPPSKSLRMISWVVISCGLVSCGRNENAPPNSGTLTETPAAPVDRTFQADDVLPGSREVYERLVRNGGKAELADDIPSMSSKGIHFYSRVGSARAFMAICGFQMPDWVEPLGGRAGVSQVTGGTLRTSDLEYRIPTEKRGELERLVVEANAREHPRRLPVTFYSSTREEGTRVGSITFKPDGVMDESMSVIIESDGVVRLRASRGPVGWED
jgi:hypothetical protein